MSTTFASQHTTSFPQLLRQAGVSLLVSTYQAGQVIVLRADGEALNTHFCAMEKPMGMAASGARLAVGSGFQVWDYYNMPAVAARLDPPGRHDACYLPRRIHVTGDIDIHEMEIDRDGELWLVNTRMSCLCTLTREHSVVPRWRPPFVSAYDLGDRCHLNGLALRDGRPAFVTALGRSDTPGGWREHKAHGGLLLEYPGGRILADGLSMPHSPRWYGDRLWVLESGAGRLCTVDPGSGGRRVVAELPGFTRGLSFIDRYALIGLSQVRETAVFAGLPLTQRVAERQCGVWVVDVVSGQTVAYVVFTGDVREIFAVTPLPARYPALLELVDPLTRSSYALPERALAELAPVDPAAELLTQATRAHTRKRLDDAIAGYRQLLNRQPGNVQARYQLGVALSDAERWQDACEVLGAFVAERPDHAEALNSLGHSYAHLDRPAQALRCYERAIAADSHYATAHFNRALLLLKQGDYREGWQGYEWRWQMPSFTPFQCPQPRWEGEDIRDKTLLVHTEQGNGDAIQFARFLPAAASRCKKLVLVCGENLRPLLAALPGVAETRTPGAVPQDSFDTYCPLMSLARILDVTLDDLPAVEEPYLRAPARISVPALDGAGCRIGIAWRGSPTHGSDHHRSCELARMLTLVAGTPSGASWYSLQVGLDKAQRELLARHGVVDLEPELSDYARSAALVAQLDLVISVDTSVAHLAAALGKPAWILLGRHSDWRWLAEGERSSWYASARLFRQPDGGWPATLERVAGALAARLRT